MAGQPPSLFEVDDSSRPLADRPRPRTLAEVVGQDHLLATDAPIGRANYFPDDMPRQTFYDPTTGGYESVITERLRHWANLRSNRAATDDTTTNPVDDSSTSDDN